MNPLPIATGLLMNLKHAVLSRKKNKVQMGNEQAKPTDRLKHIDKDVKSLSSNFRGSKRASKEEKERIVESLAKYSNEANALRGRVKDRYVDDIQRNITYAMNEVLSSQDENLDQGAVETNSFVQMPLNKRLSLPRSTSETPMKKTKSDNGLYRHPVPTIQDVETKLKTLRPKIKQAIDDKDSTQLRLHQQTIKVLATDLEMIDAIEQTPIGDRKEKLVAIVTNQYQKINKAMKEIRRSKDLSYLAKREAKEKTLKDLEEIRKSLDGTNMLITQAMKNEDAQAIKNAEMSLEDINRRLGTTEAIDEETNNLKAQMMDKISWLERYIQKSDLTRAESSYEDLIKTIASGKVRDNEEIQGKLESLHTFVENIPEDEENSLKRKEKLLSNILQSVALMKDDKHTDKRSTSFVAQLEDISKLWNDLKGNLRVETLKKAELKQIDEILYKLQTSINDTRNNFRKTKNPLQSALNYSTPNLTSPGLVKKYSSSLSIDGTVSEQATEVDKSKTSLDKDAFAEIEEIKTQVYYIREKFQESVHKQHLKNKLDSYLQILKQFINSPNQALSNNARIVQSDIQDILRNKSPTHDAPPEKRSSLEDKFEHIIVVQENVEELAKIVNKFSGNTSDSYYKNTRQQLVENKEYLDSIQVPNQYSMINQQKSDVLKKIEYLLDMLQKKAAHVYRESPVMTATKKKLDALKEKVNRFNGAYKGVLYNQIEKDLNKLLVEACEKIDNVPQAEDIMKETEKYLKILEHRATREQSFRQTTRSPKSEDEDSFSKLKHELINIKSTIDNNNTPSTGVEMFLGLKSRLDLVKLGLDQLKCLKDEDYHQRDFLYNEVETLSNFVEAKIALSQKALEQFPMEDTGLQNIIHRLDKIEESFRKLASEIRHFIGTKSDERFYELDEASMKLISRMDEIELPIGSDLQKRKLSLLREIYQFGELLEKRAKDTETLLQFERDIQDIENNFERYTQSTEDLGKLADKVKALRIDLESNNFNTILRDRKKKCVGRYQEVSNKIERNCANKELAKIQDDLEKVALEIEHFQGLQADKRYYELDDSISQYFSKVDCLTIPENSTLHRKKIALLKEIQSYSQLLDRKCKENEICKDLDFKLTTLAKKLDKVSGKSQELALLQQDLKLIESKISNSSIDRITKENFSRRYRDLLSKINAFKKRSESTENFKGIGTYEANIRKDQTSTNPQRDSFVEAKQVVNSEVVSVAKEQYSQELRGSRSSLKSEDVVAPKEHVNDQYRGGSEISKNEATKEGKEAKDDFEEQDIKIENVITSKDTKGESKLVDGAKKQNNEDLKTREVVNPKTETKNPRRATQTAEAELNRIEAVFRKIVPEIRNFVGTTVDDKFYELDETSTKLILTMDEMELPKGSELYMKKLNLLKELFKFGDLLDNRAKDTETLIQYENEIKDIEGNFEKSISSKADLERLIERVKVLKLNLQVNSLNTLLRERREICIDKIKAILDKIESLDAEVDISEQISSSEKQFKDIMKEIEKFSGVHSDKRYQELDLILVKLFSSLDSLDINDESDVYKRKTFLLRELQNYRQILDTRASETEFYREIRKRAEVGKGKLDTFSGSFEELKKIESELKGINSEIDEADLRDSLRHELKQRLGSVMTKYKIMMKKFKTAKGSPDASPVKNYKEFLEFKLNELEEELDGVQRRVAGFRDVEGSEEYLSLEDSLRNFSMVVKKLEVPSDSQYYNRKIDLKRRAVESLTQLDERAEGVETILDVEKDLDMVKEKIHQNLSDQEKNQLDERLIAIQVKLSKLQLDPDLVDRRSTCENSAFLFMKQLKQKGLQPPEEDSSGTFV